jgi:hypothetical protein
LESIKLKNERFGFITVNESHTNITTSVNGEMIYNSKGKKSKQKRIEDLFN